MVLFYLFLTKIKQIRLICSILILIEANKVILLKKTNVYRIVRRRLKRNF